LDSNKEVYIEKLISLIVDSEINSITVMKMEVPCCNGLLQIAQVAVNESKRNIQLNSITVGMQGDIKN